MQGYDWDFGFGFGHRHSALPRGYDAGFGGGARGRGGPGGSGRYQGGQAGRGGFGGGRGGPRGVYGGDYPGFGGVPGGRERGMYYGGGQRSQQGGYGGDYGRGGMRGQQGRQFSSGGGGGYGGFGGNPYGQRSGGGGYDRGYAEEPFLPESAYRMHPELGRPQTHRSDRWQGESRGMASHAMLDDAEIEQAVRQNLYQDNWLDADSIEVEVNGGVVSLRGEVDDYLQARYAWDDTWETEGVRGVMNQLTVRVDIPAESGDMPQSTSGESAGEAGGETKS
jgi:hypothetical protein